MKYLLTLLLATCISVVYAEGIPVDTIQVDPIEPSEIVPYIIQDEVGPTLELYKTFANLVIDKRNLYRHKQLFIADTTLISKWLAIYQATYEPITKVVMPSNVRMIAEVRLPKNQEQQGILDINLEYYKTVGYNAVLLAFSGDEDPSALRDLAVYIKNTYNYNVWYTFGPTENIVNQTFIDPDTYSVILQALAPVCSGYLSGWKRTSVHLFYQDDKFMQYTATKIRAANPTIPILGEIYWGPTVFSDSKVTEYDLKKYRNTSRRWYQYDSLCVRGVDNCSGWLVVGFSSTGYNVEGVMTTFLKPYTGPKLVVITGGWNHFPLLLQTISYADVQRSIVALRTRWFNAGAYGVLVPHAGLINETKYPEYTDNLSVLPYTVFTNN